MPVGISIGIGTLGMIVAGFLAAIVPVGDPGGRFTVVAVAVGLFAALSLDQSALFAVALIGALIFNGFLEGRSGQLAWHGTDDLWRLLILVMVGVFGLAVGEAVRFLARRRGE